VEAASQSIAHLGDSLASCARIALWAGLDGTGMISYCFSGKDDLIGRAIAEIAPVRGRCLAQHREAQPTPVEALPTFMHATVACIATHPTCMTVLLDSLQPGGIPCDATTEQQVAWPQEALLRSGQDGAAFRVFHTRVMATVVWRAREGLLPPAAALALDVDAHEVVTMFALSARRTA
jgi:hypothetical protein